MNEPQLSSWTGLHGVALSAAHAHKGGRSDTESFSWAMGLRRWEMPSGTGGVAGCRGL